MRFKQRDSLRSGWDRESGKATDLGPASGGVQLEGRSSEMVWLPSTGHDQHFALDWREKEPASHEHCCNRSKYPRSYREPTSPSLHGANWLM